MTTRNPDTPPMHPGELLREDMLPAVKRPKTEIAAGLGLSRQHLDAVLAEERPVSPELAVRLAKMFGGSPESWLRMQASHDVWHAERNVDVSQVPRLEAAQ